MYNFELWLWLFLKNILTFTLDTCNFKFNLQYD